MDSRSPSPPAGPLRRRTKTCARRCERACCTVATYFPLAFVYGLTTWAIYVEAGLGFRPSLSKGHAYTFKPTSVLGIAFYLLLNASYTTAVFVDPGSPIREPGPNGRAKYSSLPTVEPSHDLGHIRPITVSSTGAPRYCKKCHTSKPDRTHHCSTCKRCVLKMDHHCPWLAACVGLHNCKAFILFLIYTCMFCWVCFGSSGYWVWMEVFEQSQYLEEFAPVNVILLAVISGIIGLVLTGFTSWHLYLCCRGQTTIECLEKTRYLGSVRRRVERQRQDQLQHHRRGSSEGVMNTLQRAGDQIIEFHANAVPGATRLEEGEERTSPATNHRSLHQPFHDFEPTDNESPAQQALRRTYSAMEEDRERDRYQDYMDDKESEKLPNAFDLGWKRNLMHLFGPNPWLWLLPICNTTGDGWKWEVSPKWIQATEEAARRREAHSQVAPYDRSNVRLRGGNEYADADLENGYGYSHEEAGRPPRSVSLQTLNRPGHFQANARRRHDVDVSEDGSIDHYEVSSDEEAAQKSRSEHKSNGRPEPW